MQCEVEIDTQPCSAGKYGSVLLISSPAMSCQAISRPRFRGFEFRFRVPGRSETRSFERKTGVCCRQAEGKRDANLSRVRRFLGKYP